MEENVQTQSQPQKNLLKQLFSFHIYNQYNNDKITKKILNLPKNHYYYYEK